MKRKATTTAKRKGFKKARRTTTTTRKGIALGVELKFYDQKLINAALTAPTDATGGEHNPSATISLNTVVQGDGESNRDGRQIVMKKLSVMGNIFVPAQTNQTVSDEAGLVYVSIVLDTQTNGALLNSEDVFKNVGAAAVTAAQPFHNLAFTNRFRVLKSVKIEMDQQNQVHDATNIEIEGYTKPFEMHVNFKDLVVNYSNTSETILNITDNGLNIIAWCSNTGQAPVLNYQSRLRFVG